MKTVLLFFVAVVFVSGHAYSAVVDEQFLDLKPNKDGVVRSVDGYLEGSTTVRVVGGVFDEDEGEAGQTRDKSLYVALYPNATRRGGLVLVKVPQGSVPSATDLISVTIKSKMQIEGTTIKIVLVDADGTSVVSDAFQISTEYKTVTSKFSELYPWDGDPGKIPGFDLQHVTYVGIWLPNAKPGVEEVYIVKQVTWKKEGE